MKATGIVRRVDDLGRIVLPKELRDTLHIDEKDPMEFYVREDSIVLKKYQPGCNICGSVEDLVSYRGKNICEGCIAELKKLQE